MMIGQYLLRKLNELRQSATLCDLDLLSGEGDSFPVHHVVFVSLNQNHFELAQRRGDGDSLGHGGRRRMMLSQLTTQELDILVQFMYGKLTSRRSRYVMLERALEKLNMSYLLKEAGGFTLEPETTPTVKSEITEGSVATCGTVPCSTPNDKRPLTSRQISVSLEETPECMSPSYTPVVKSEITEEPVATSETAFRHSLGDDGPVASRPCSTLEDKGHVATRLCSTSVDMGNVASRHCPTSNYKRPVTSVQCSPTDDKEHVASVQSSTTDDKRPGASRQSSTMDDERPVASIRCSTTDEKGQCFVASEATPACMSPSDIHAGDAPNETSVYTNTGISNHGSVKKEQDSSELVSMELRNLHEGRDKITNGKVQNQSLNTANAIVTLGNEKPLSPSEQPVDPLTLDSNADVIKMETANEKQDCGTETVIEVILSPSVDILNESMDDECDQEMALIDELVHEFAVRKSDTVNAKGNTEAVPRRDCIACNHDLPTVQGSETMDTVIQEESAPTDVSLPFQNYVENDRIEGTTTQEFDYKTLQKNITRNVNIVLSATTSIRKIITNLVQSKKSTERQKHETKNLDTNLASDWLRGIDQSDANMQKVNEFSKKLKDTSEPTKQRLAQEANKCTVDTCRPNSQVGKSGNRNVFETIAETNSPLTAKPANTALTNQALPSHGKALFVKTAVSGSEDQATTSTDTQNAGASSGSLPHEYSNVAVIIPAQIAGHHYQNSNGPFKTMNSKSAPSLGKNRWLLPKPVPSTSNIVTTGTNASLGTLSESASIALGVLSNSVSHEMTVKCDTRRHKDLNKASKSLALDGKADTDSCRQVTSTKGAGKADNNSSTLEVNANTDSQRQKVICTLGSNKTAGKTSESLAQELSAETYSCVRNATCAEGMDTEHTETTESASAYEQFCEKECDTSNTGVPSNNTGIKPSSKSSLIEQLLFNKTTEVAEYPVLKKMLSPCAKKSNLTHSPTPAEQSNDHVRVGGYEFQLPEMRETHSEEDRSKCQDLNSEPPTMLKETVTQKCYGDTEMLGRLQSLLPPATSYHKPCSKQKEIRPVSHSEHFTVDPTVHYGTDRRLNKEKVTQKQFDDTEINGRLPFVLAPSSSGDVRNNSNETVMQRVSLSEHSIMTTTCNSEVYNQTNMPQYLTLQSQVMKPTGLKGHNSLGMTPISLNRNEILGIKRISGQESTCYPEKKRKRHSSIGSSRVRKQNPSKRRRSIEVTQTNQEVNKLAPIEEKVNSSSKNVELMDYSIAESISESIHGKQNQDDKVKPSLDNKDEQSLDEKMKYLPRESYDTDEDESLPLVAHVKRTGMNETRTDGSKLTGKHVYDGDVTIEYSDNENVIKSFCIDRPENTAQGEKLNTRKHCEPAQMPTFCGNQQTKNVLSKESGQTVNVVEDPRKLADLTVEGNNNEKYPDLMIIGSSHALQDSPVMRTETTPEAVRSPELAKLLSASVKMAKVKTRVGLEKKPRNPRKKCTAKAKHMSFQPRNQIGNASKEIEIPNSKRKFRAIYPKSAYNVVATTFVRVPEINSENGAAQFKPSPVCELFQVNNDTPAKPIAFVNTRSDSTQSCEALGNVHEAPDRNQEILKIFQDIPKKVHEASGTVLETPWKRQESLETVHEISDVLENTPNKFQKTSLTFHQTPGSIPVTPNSCEGPAKVKENTIRGVPLKFSPKTPTDSQFQAVQKIKMNKRILGQQWNAKGQARKVNPPQRSVQQLNDRPQVSLSKGMLVQQASPVTKTPPVECEQNPQVVCAVSANSDNIPDLDNKMVHVQCPLDLPVLSKRTLKKGIMENKY